MFSYLSVYSTVIFAGIIIGTVLSSPARRIGDSSHDDSPIPSLICNCTGNASRFCGSEGTCNAVEVAKLMRGSLRNAKDVMRILWEFPGDKPHQQKRASLCGELFGPAGQNGTLVDIMLLDFMDWVPSCGRIYTDSGEEQQMCTMAPDNMPQHIPFPKELIDIKVKKLYDFLGCGELTFELPEFQGQSMGYCSEGDYCNTLDLSSSEETKTTTEKTEELSGSEVTLGTPEKIVEINEIDDSESFDQAMLLYILLPIVGVLMLALLLLFIGYKLSLWTYVYNVSGKEKKLGASSSEDNSVTNTGTSTTV